MHWTYENSGDKWRAQPQLGGAWYDIFNPFVTTYPDGTTVDTAGNIVTPSNVPGGTTIDASGNVLDQSGNIVSGPAQAALMLTAPLVTLIKWVAIGAVVIGVLEARHRWFE